MTHYNPMLERLQQQIQEYNKDTEAKMEEVAYKQNLITLGVVLFNFVVFLILESFLGKKEPLFLDIPNTVLNFVTALILLLVSFPFASKFVKRNMRILQLNEEQIDANMNYAGLWEYETNFHVESPDDGTKTFKLLKSNIEDLEQKLNYLIVFTNSINQSKNRYLQQSSEILLFFIAIAQVVPLFFDLPILTHRVISIVTMVAICIIGVLLIRFNPNRSLEKFTIFFV